MKLVLIESPGKLKTISKILGKDYKILPTIGHIQKLDNTYAYKTGIDVKNNFKADYVFDTSKKDVLKNIKDAAKDAEIIYIASDGDREGHVISAEIEELLSKYKKKLVRITFNEITEKAIKSAIEHPSGFNREMIDAGYARGIIDRLLGYRLSPLVKSKLGADSAGRVQSALLRIIAEREEAIQKFKSDKYYEIFIDFKKRTSALTAKLFQVDKKKIERFDDKKTVDGIIENCKKGEYSVQKVNEKEKLLEPKLPLTTSAMQQLASTVLGFSPAKTQKAAQGLYESGHCTYIRTDSVRFSDDFIVEAKAYIQKNFDKKLYRGLNIPEDKNKNAQDGHESIRPTHLEDTPEKLSQLLETDQYKLYKLIYNYSLAAFFVPAKIKETEVIIENGKYLFKISGKSIVLDSFISLIGIENEFKSIPEFKEKEEILVKDIYAEEKETQPPQRYSEAGLVKVLETTGIGRPSTYSGTIETLKKREYIKIDKKSVVCTELGMKVANLCKNYLSEVINTEYTAQMESYLDEISSGEKKKLEILNEFWNTFEPILLRATKEINKDKPKAEIVEGKVCPNCKKPLVIRESKYGKFYACSGFPKCRYTEKIETSLLEAEEIPCPECGIGHMVQRKNKKGQIFYGCSRFKDGCKSTLNEEEMKKYKEKLKENTQFLDKD